MRDCQATSGGQAKVVRRRLDAVRHFSTLESAGYLATSQRRPPCGVRPPSQRRPYCVECVRFASMVTLTRNLFELVYPYWVKLVQTSNVPIRRSVSASLRDEPVCE